MMTTEFTTGHAANGVDKVSAIKILEPVLVRVMSVGTMIEVIRRRVFTTFLVTSILGIWSAHVE